MERTAAKATANVGVLALAILVVVTGCGGDGSSQSDEATAAYRQGDGVVVQATEDSEQSTGDRSAAESTDSRGTSGQVETETASPTAAPVEEIPWKIQRPQGDTAVTAAPDSTTTSTTAVGQSDGAPSGSSGAEAAPSARAATVVTTIPGASGGVASLYKGFLGTLDRNKQIVDPLGSPPATQPGTMPLTGLPGVAPSRPAAIVKIDNGPAARPQSGLNAADIVIEEEVEGGVTRFAAVFHSTSATVGPVRSARTTDIGIINSFGSPLLMYSGANEVTEGLIRAQPTVQNRNAGTSSGYWRSSGRRAPSNLYTDTASHWASAGSGPPPAQFAYRALGERVTSVHNTAVTDDQFSIAFQASTAGWSWNGSAWLRTQGGSSHMTSSGQQVSAANVVVIEAREVPTGMVDSTGAKVPEFVFVGSGDVSVFTDGKRIDGRWNRPSLAVAPTLMSGGQIIELTPGRTWIELIGRDKGLLG